jgi:hypothetical protein
LLLLKKSIIGLGDDIDQGIAQTYYVVGNSRIAGEVTGNKSDV